MFIVLFVVLAIIAVILVIFNLPVFGRLPNYLEGTFKNISPTPMKPEGVGYLTIIASFFKKIESSRPSFLLPSIKPDFARESGTKIIWFGHSSYLIQSDGLNILVDPVFSKTTSPFSFIGYKSYGGTDFIRPEDFPEIDILLITHDHYDHLDYPSILKFKAKTKLFLTSMGVGSHLERWGVQRESIKELLWDQEFCYNERIKFTALTARHFSGRLIKRNRTLWSSFVLQLGVEKIYVGGDSGYDTHFSTIGKQYGPFDLAILECGQYNKYWPYIHMFPEQTIQAAEDLGATWLLPVHWGKFTLAQHAWDEPIERLLIAKDVEGVKVTTPIPGEAIRINDYYPTSQWWRN